MQEETIRFQNDIKDLDQKFANEIGGFCKVLTEKNNYNFSWTELLLFQPINVNTNTGISTTSTNNVTGGTVPYTPELFYGQWKSADDASNQIVGYINIYADGKFYYYFISGDSTYGNWQLTNNQIKLMYNRYWGAGQSYLYDITAANSRGFNLRLVDPPYNSFSFSRQ